MSRRIIEISVDIPDDVPDDVAANYVAVVLESWRGCGWNNGLFSNVAVEHEIVTQGEK